MFSDVAPQKCQIQGSKTMACKRCSSENQSGFGVEMNIHFSGLKAQDKTHEKERIEAVRT